MKNQTLNSPEKLEAFWSALPDASCSFWRTELVSIRSTMDRVADLERQAEEMRRLAQEESEELGRRMLAQANREWPAADVETALKEVAA